MTDSIRVAAVQAAPIALDRERSTEKACDLIADASATGASLAAFGEAWIPGYPSWALSGGIVERSRMAARYLDHAVDVPSATTDRLCDAARRNEIDVVIGITERDVTTSGTAYCTLLFIGADGTLLGRHRKLKPTGGERTVWGDGDAVGLRVHQRPYGRLSGLNCWEHQMVLPGYVLMAEGTQIHVAAWPGERTGDGPSLSRQLLLSRAFASQAACYVVAVGSATAADQQPARAGLSTIIDPFGEIAAGPVETSRPSWPRSRRVWCARRGWPATSAATTRARTSSGCE